MSLNRPCTLLAITIAATGCNGYSNNKSIRNEDALRAVSASGKYKKSRICLKLNGKLPLLLPSDDPTITSKVNALAEAGLVDLKKTSKIGDVLSSSGRRIDSQYIRDTRKQANSAILAGADPDLVRERFLTLLKGNGLPKSIMVDLDAARTAKLSKLGREVSTDNGSSFCFSGKPSGTKIVLASTPTNAGSFITSLAVYEYVLDPNSIPDWAKNPSVTYAFPEARAAQGVIRDKELLISTAEGWATASDL